MILDAIDPGARARKKRVSYRARYDAGELIQVDAINYAAAWRIGREEPPDIVVVEKPQIDGRTVLMIKGFAAISWYGALTIGALGAKDLVEYESDDWKGQVAKPVHHLKFWRVLSTLERKCFPPDTEEIIERGVEATAQNGGKLADYGDEVTNMLDAANIGAFHLKRIGKGGAKVR